MQQRHLLLAKSKLFYSQPFAEKVCRTLPLIYTPLGASSGLRPAGILYTPTTPLPTSTPWGLLMIFLESCETNVSVSKLPDIWDGTPSDQVLDNYLASMC